MTETLNAYDAAVAKCKAAGTYVGLVDAIEDLMITITPHHIRIAKQKDQSECVLAQSVLSLFDDEDVIVSVGHSLVKILNTESGMAVRYGVSPQLSRALKHFDLTGEWSLPMGDYVLKVPDGSLALRENQDERIREQTDRRLEKFQQRLELGETAGTGFGRHVSQPINSRIVTGSRLPDRLKKQATKKRRTMKKTKAR